MVRKRVEKKVGGMRARKIRRKYFLEKLCYRAKIIFAEVRPILMVKTPAPHQIRMQVCSLDWLLKSTSFFTNVALNS